MNKSLKNKLKNIYNKFNIKKHNKCKNLKNKYNKNLIKLKSIKIKIIHLIHQN